MKVTESELRAMREKVGSGRVGCKETPGVDTPKVDRSSPYKSKLEAAFGGYLHVLMLAGDITHYRYEQVRLKLSPDITYVPDFWVRNRDGSEVFYEVKGCVKNLLSRAGMLKVKLAAAHWPFWRFIVVTRYRGQWEQRVMGYENQAVMQ